MLLRMSGEDWSAPNGIQSLRSSLEDTGLKRSCLKKFFLSRKCLPVGRGEKSPPPRTPPPLGRALGRTVFPRNTIPLLSLTSVIRCHPAKSWRSPRHADCKKRLVERLIDGDSVTSQGVSGWYAPQHGCYPGLTLTDD